ncbi:hypothetical protein JYU34_006794 [Plutella xylostella]|uniref:Aminopeptidase n=1 Tax=Plutella xylostella TaxID=51655 RepID=A0ABQ7QSZ0_PLUXY|nr:hypothetical protein JYU34_006794 [Plutella xylostella]
MIPQLFSFLILLNSASAYFINEEECLNYTVYPVQYELKLIPHILRDGTSYLDCDITITVIANARQVQMIELDAKDLEIHRESVKVFKNEVNIISSVRPYEYDRRMGKLYLYLREELEPYSERNTQYYIKMFFRKFLKSDEVDDGIFFVKYEEAGRQKSMIATRLSPDRAKYFFPCFQNPQFEAVFRFKVLLPNTADDQLSDTSLTVAEELQRHSQKDYQTAIQYIPSPQVAVHQVGFHHSDFASKSVSATLTNDTLTLWAPSTHLAKHMFILKFGQSVLDVIQEYSSGNRPLVNGPINIVAMPKTIETYEAGSWNLLTVGEHKLSNIPQYTSIMQKEQMSYLLTQQLSRIWLGNPGEVERTRWKQEWFKEGMATYFGYYFLSQSGRSFWDMSVYGLQTRNKAMMLDWRPETPNLESFNRTLAINIPSRYHPLVSYKTAALIWMVENWLGSDKFHRALVNYLNTRRGKFVSVEDFTTFLQSETVECEFFKGYTVSDVLSSWFRQPGYPVVKATVYRNQDTQDIVYLEQKQFTFSNVTRGHHKYLIPISYFTQYTENCFNCFQPKFTIADSGYTFKENLNGGWIILNRNASGYYRVNYDNVTWKMIVNTLNSPERYRINALNRAQILNDAFALYMSGDITYELAMEIVSSLEHEDSYVVWDAVLSGYQMLKIDGAVGKMTKQLYNEWKMLLREVISNVYRRVYNDIDRDDRIRMFRTRIITFACSIGHAPCLRDLEPALHQVTRSLYDPDLRQICYFTLLNRSDGYDSIKTVNSFEREDFNTAERLAKEEVRFFYRLPVERLRPMPLIESSTVTTFTPVTAIKPVPREKASSSNSIHRWSDAAIMSAFALIAFINW